jgi:hypothetical protein
MQGLTEDQHKAISKKLDTEGFEASRWKPFFIDRIAKDIAERMAGGASFDGSLQEITSDIDKQKIPLLEDVYPNFKSLKVYKLLIKIGAWLSGLCILAAVVFFILGWTLALPLLFTGLMFFLFGVFPIRFLSGSIKDKQENVYIAIFRLHLK